MKTCLNKYCIDGGIFNDDIGKWEDCPACHGTGQVDGGSEKNFGASQSNQRVVRDDKREDVPCTSKGLPSFTGGANPPVAELPEVEMECPKTIDMGDGWVMERVDQEDAPSTPGEEEVGMSLGQIGYEGGIDTTDCSWNQLDALYQMNWEKAAQAIASHIRREAQGEIEKWKQDLLSLTRQHTELLQKHAEEYAEIQRLTTLANENAALAVEINALKDELSRKLITIADRDKVISDAVKLQDQKTAAHDKVYAENERLKGLLGSLYRDFANPRLSKAARARITALDEKVVPIPTAKETKDHDPR